MSPLSKRRKRASFFIWFLLMVILGVGFLSYAALNNYREDLIQQRSDRSKALVANAFNLLTYFHDRGRKGDLPLDQAQKYALDAIRQLPPDQNLYFWVMDTKTNVIMHPHDPSLEGRNMSDYTTKNGRKLFVEIAQAALSSNEAQVSYNWSKPDRRDNLEYEKVSYFKFYAPWNWIVGMGYYIDDINEAIDNALCLAVGLLFAIVMFVSALGLTISENLKRHAMESSRF